MNIKLKKMLFFFCIGLWLNTVLAYGIEVYTSASLSAPVRKEIENIQKYATIFRLTKDYPFPGEAYSFEYLLDRLHVFTVIANEIVPAFKSHKAEMESQGVYYVTDSRRIDGRVEVVFSTPNRRVYLGEGGYNLFWNVRFTGRGFAVIDFREDSFEGNPQVITTTRFYFKVDSIPLRALVKIVNFLIPRLVDNKINLFLHTTERVMEEINRNPQVIYNTLMENGDVSIEEAKEFSCRFMQNTLFCKQG